MNVIAMMLFLQAGAVTPCPTPSPSLLQQPALIVQAVGPDWLPLPGIEVAVVRRGHTAEKSIVRTDVNGYAEFQLARDGEFSVEAWSKGFKKARLKSLRLSTTSGQWPTAYVQFRMTLSGPYVVVE